jgi:hypothetical protein
MKSLFTIIKDLTAELQKELDGKKVNEIKKTYLTEKIKMLKGLGNTRNDTNPCE